MKNLLPIIILFAIISSCKSQKVNFNQINEYGKNVAITDSTLHSMQQKNDLMLVFANENFAWSRITQYQILAFNNGKWQAYSYAAKNYVTPESGLPQTPFDFRNIPTSSATCDSVWQYFVQHEVWKIKGDEGKNFCTDENKNCTINDATHWRLMIITKSKLTDASYYAPEFFEKCCPGNLDRKTFVEASKKIQSIVNGEEE